MSDTIRVNNRPVKRELIKGVECVFATYSSNRHYQTDALIVKENVFFKDGTIEPNLRILKDQKWPFYITKDGAARNHVENKEWEDLSKLNKYTSTRLHLAKNVSNALGYGQGLPLKQLQASPYLYGTDILPTALIKERYQRRSPDCTTVTFNVAGVDTETDVVHGHGEVIVSNITYKDRAYTAVTEEFVNGEDHASFIQRCRDKAEYFMGDDLRRRNLKWEIEIVPNAGVACARTIEKAHEYRPDFISIWNMDFDISVMERDLKKYGFDCNTVFSDPSVPEEYQFFNYRRGQSYKITQDGKQISLHPAERWHVVTCPASFYFVDAMCLYKRIRTAAGNESSYKLDYILKKHKLDAKLKIQEIEHLEEDGGLWHYEMQTNYRHEYVVYNLRDDLALEDLDAKIGDIGRAFNALAGISDLSNFARNPRRIMDDMHFFVQQFGKVIGSTAPDLQSDPNQKLLLSMNDWIITLPSYMIHNGMNIFEDAPELVSMVYRYLADLDISSTYPSGQLVENISKETTAFETCQIQGFTEADLRYLGLTLTTGKSSALELAIRYLNYPSPEQLLYAYDISQATSGEAI